MKNFVVITSIFAPSEAVRRFATKPDWQLVVVGDKKTPVSWQCPDAIYISPGDQQKMHDPFISKLPWNNYCRKMAGYIYAMRHGAEIIADSDDDNIPYDSWGKDVTFSGTFPTIGDSGFHNIYTYYTDAFIWPRGFPLTHILGYKKVKPVKRQQTVGLWQELVDTDPDVDAIYRMTDNTPVTFLKNGKMVLGKQAVTPLNSQNTIFRSELFLLMYLPVYVPFRFTDILRGLVAQPILWSEGYHVGINEASVFQKRNPHDYLVDFELEIPAYLYSGKIIPIVTEAIKGQGTLEEKLNAAYTALAHYNIIEKKEMELLREWIKLYNSL
jgi:hypothetical protein